MNPANPRNSKWMAFVALGLVGLTLYWTFTYSGPFRYLAERELKWFGVYSPELTAMVIILGFLVLAAIVKVTLRGAERPVPSVAGAPSAPGIGPVLNVQPPQAWLQYARFAGPVIVVGIGGWAYLNGTQAGSLKQLSAADFEQGTVQSRIVYADVRGRLGGTYLGKDHYLYIPMATQGNDGSPVRLLVGVDENQTRKYLHREPDGSFTVRGVADKGLEGDVKYAFQKNGIAVADTVWVVHAGREPGNDRTFGIIMAIVGVVFAGLLYGVESYRKKKRAARPLQALA